MKIRNIDYSQKVLEVKDLKQYFKVGVGSRKMIIKAVDGISFDIYKREVFGLVGESGCGKTTTGRTIIRIYDATDGTVTYNGKVINAGVLGNKERIRQAKKEYKYEIIQQNPSAKRLYDAKQKGKELIHNTNQEIANLKLQLGLVAQENAKKAKELNNQLEIAFHHYETKLNVVKRKYEAEINRVTEKDIKDLFHIHNKTLHLINKKAAQKMQYIKSLPTDRDEIANKLSEASETHHENLKAAADRLIINIKRIDTAILNEYEEKIIHLTPVHFHSHIKAKDVEDKINEIKARYHLVFSELKSNYDLEVAEIKAQNLTGLNGNNGTTEAMIKQQIDDLKLSISGIQQKVKKEIQTIKDELKNNQVAPKVNEEDKLKIKDKYQNIISKERSLIKEKRTQNKSIDTETMTTMQMVFQDPIASLNPRMIVRDIISEGLVVRGEKDKKLISEKVARILDIVGLSPDHATRYPHEFSGGQRQRIGVARALVVEPDFIIADEPISALDVSIQAQVINLLNDLKDELGLTILFIAHDLSVVKYFCDRIAVMYYGKIVELASSEELFLNPLHPYTKSLLSAIPQPDPKSESTRTRKSYNPRMHDYSKDKPKLLEIKPGHFIYANEKEFAEYQKEIKVNEGC